MGLLAWLVMVNKTGLLPAVEGKVTIATLLPDFVESFCRQYIVRTDQGSRAADPSADNV